MHELRRKGQEISSLNKELQEVDRQSKRAHVLRGQVEGIYRETEVIAEEWASEVQYVHFCEDLLSRYVARETRPEAAPEVASEATGLGVVVTGFEPTEARARLEARHDFVLLQSLSEGAQTWVGFQPRGALADHREFLNEILSASELDPFLLRLSGEQRDVAANLLGRAIASFVPEDRIDDVHMGRARVADFPGFAEVLGSLRDEALSARARAAALASPQSMMQEA